VELDSLIVTLFFIIMLNALTTTLNTVVLKYMNELDEEIIIGRLERELLVNVIHGTNYRYEEFHYRDGELEVIVRGVNATKGVDAEIIIFMITRNGTLVRISL